MNFTIGLVASLSLYSSNPFETSFTNSFNSEINHLSRLLSSVSGNPFDSNSSIFAYVVKKEYVFHRGKITFFTTSSTHASANLKSCASTTGEFIM